MWVEFISIVYCLMFTVQVCVLPQAMPEPWLWGESILISTDTLRAMHGDTSLTSGTFLNKKFKHICTHTQTERAVLPCGYFNTNLGKDHSQAYIHTYIHAYAHMCTGLTCWWTQGFLEMQAVPRLTHLSPESRVEAGYFWNVLSIWPLKFEYRPFLTLQSKGYLQSCYNFNSRS